MNSWTSFFECLFGRRKMTRYNNGVCSKCGHWLVMYHKNSDGTYNFKCPKCNHTVSYVERWEMDIDHRLHKQEQRKQLRKQQREQLKERRREICKEQYM